MVTKTESVESAELLADESEDGLRVVRVAMDAEIDLFPGRLKNAEPAPLFKYHPEEGVSFTVTRSTDGLELLVQLDTDAVETFTVDVTQFLALLANAVYESRSKL